MRIYTTTFITMLLSVTISCTGENVIDKRENAAPKIVIMSHSSGVDVQDGYVEHFRATVSDDDNEFGDLSIIWYVGEEVQCDWTVANAAGESFCDIVFSEGDTNVIAEVRDTQGTGGRAEITVNVLPTESPVVELLSPVASSNYYVDQLVNFSALVSDTEDSADQLLITWTSSVDGELPLDTTVNSAGDLSDFTYLSQGNHAIELRVEDSSGKFTTEEVVIRVGGENHVPTCQITEPAESSMYGLNQPIRFRAIVGDEDIQPLDLSITWVSDKDGEFGSSIATSDGSVTYSYDGLSANEHTVTIIVEDEVGARCSAQTLISVGNAPISAITSPTDFDVFSVGDTITFRASVQDIEDSPNNIAVEWSSDIDGVLHSANANSQGITQFTASNLSAGQHGITLRATDTTGLVGDDLISIVINTAPVIDDLVLQPTPVYGDDTLYVIPSTSDADGHSVTVQYTWYENGVLTSFTGNSIASSELQAGEMWTVRAIPNDGYTNGDVVETSIVVSDSPPTVSNVAIAPTTVYNDSVVTCSATASDIDQVVNATYSWNINGFAFPGASLDIGSISVVPTDVLTCVATVVDQVGHTATDSAVVVVNNRNPVVNSVSINPNLSVYSDSVLQCSAQTSDADGESLTLSYSWQVGGGVVGSGSSITLGNQIVSPSDTVACVVTAQDNYGGTASASSTVLVNNSNPQISSTQISPAMPMLSDTITCSANVVDVDGINPVVGFVLQNQTSGQSYTPTSTSLAFPIVSATLDLASVSVNPDDVLSCQITAVDLDGGVAVSSVTAVVLGNSPSISSISITPNSNVVTGTALLCQATAFDPNDGTLSPSYSWTVQGNVVSNTSSFTVSATNSNPTDTVTCTATATDSDGNVATSSATVTIQNTAPTLSGIAVSPSPVYNDSLAVCSATVYDPDENPTNNLAINYTWSDSGGVLFTGNPFDLQTATLLPGDSLTCSASSTDNQGQNATQNTNVSISNRSPTIPTVSITWGGFAVNPLPNDTLTCSASTVSDPDGQSVSYTYSWTSATGQTATGATLAGSNVASGDNWTCTVAVSDGISTVSASANIDVGSVIPPGCNITNCDNSLDLGNGLYLDMITIYAGTFNMGSPSTETGRGSDETEHAVTLTQDYYMMTTEVSQGMFEVLLGYQAHTGKATTDSNGSLGVGDEYPAYWVSWHMAADFANAVTQRHNTVYGTALQACYSCSGAGTTISCTQTMNPYQCDGYRLPTEAEWEYGARGGSTASLWTSNGGSSLPVGYVITTTQVNDGFDLRQYAWYYATFNNPYGSKPIALLLPNDYGVYDMAGNVQEWVHDGYASYTSNPQTNPVNTSSISKIYRGGSWNNNPDTLRAAKRGSYSPSNRYNNIGFRLVRNY